MNHQFSLEPAQRSPTAYSNREFLAALPYPVIATLDLYEHWRARNWDAIRALVLNPAVAGPELPQPLPSDEPSGPQKNQPRGVLGRLRRRRGTA